MSLSVLFITLTCSSCNVTSQRKGGTNSFFFGLACVPD